MAVRGRQGAATAAHDIMPMRRVYSRHLFMPSAVSYRLQNKRISTLYFIDLKLMVKNFLMNISSPFVVVDRYDACTNWSNPPDLCSSCHFMRFNDNLLPSLRLLSLPISDVNKLNYFRQLGHLGCGLVCVCACVCRRSHAAALRRHYSFSSYSADYE